MFVTSELFHSHPTVETPELVSIWLPTETAAGFAATPGSKEAGAARTRRARTNPKRAIRGPSAGAGSAGRSASPEAQQGPQPSGTRSHIDWLGAAEIASGDEIASEAERKRRAEWLSRGIDREIHPAIRSFQPLYPTVPEFGWDHAHIHRVEEVKGGPLIVWINDRCLVALAGLAILPMCKIGHMEANEALFEHMHDPEQPPVADPLP